MAWADKLRKIERPQRASGRHQRVGEINMEAWGRAWTDMKGAARSSVRERRACDAPHCLRAHGGGRTHLRDLPKLAESVGPVVYNAPWVACQATYGTGVVLKMRNQRNHYEDGRDTHRGLVRLRGGLY